MSEHRSGTSNSSRRMGVIIVNYGSHELLARNIDALPPDALVIVVDNFLSAHERSCVTQLCADRGWELVALPDNTGFGAACNVGMQRAVELGCACFLLLNPDASAAPDVIDALREHVLNQPMSLVAPDIANSDGEVVFQGVELLLKSGRMRRAGIGPEYGPDPEVQLWLTGACLAMHRRLLERVGGFDERYFLYWEDVDLSVRAAAAGATLVVRHDLVAIHDEGGTHSAGGGRAKSAVYYYYNCRNRLLFAATRLPRRRTLWWLLTAPGASWEILMRGGRRQLVHSTRPLRATIRGTLSGARACLGALIGRRPTRVPVQAARG